ncbi:MAG: hypothetical protein NZ518_00090 [Dehalococcoidia bacterium]|nr:hypothetical protein [Dehalococcoidia bacterium]
MAIKFSKALYEALLDNNGLRNALNNCRLFVFAGPVPGDPNDGLDMTNDHTRVVIISATQPSSPNGPDPLEFDAPSGNVLPKSSAQIWSGVAAFSGANQSSSSLPPTFFRICVGSDNGQAAGASSTIRIQGTCGLANQFADMIFSGLVTNGATVYVNVFQIVLASCFAGGDGSAAPPPS